jgi:hypothetical protein
LAAHRNRRRSITPTPRQRGGSNRPPGLVSMGLGPSAQARLGHRPGGRSAWSPRCLAAHRRYHLPTGHPSPPAPSQADGCPLLPLLAWSKDTSPAPRPHRLGLTQGSGLKPGRGACARSDNPAKPISRWGRLHQTVTKGWAHGAGACQGYGQQNKLNRLNFQRAFSLAEPHASVRLKRGIGMAKIESTRSPTLRDTPPKAVREGAPLRSRAPDRRR